jgi:hypothetical protein
VVALWAGGGVTLAQTSDVFYSTWGLGNAGADVLIKSSVPEANSNLGVVGSTVAVSDDSGCIAGNGKPMRCWGLLPPTMANVRW